MSRLINVDKTIDIIDNEMTMEDSLYNDGLCRAIQIIGEQPTVKAIPIEWLHSIMEKQIIFAMNSDGNIYFISAAIVRQVLENVIELWEKEKESRKGEEEK